MQAILQLKDCDHIKVESGGGRCVANEYRMILNTVQNSERYDDADTVQNQDPNRPESWTTTLKLSSKANSIGARSSSQSRIRHSEEATKDNRGVSKFKFGSENWNAWLAYYRAAGNHPRVSVMLAAAERGRYSEWCEVSAWPPTAVRRVDLSARAAE